MLPLNLITQTDDTQVFQDETQVFQHRGSEHDELGAMQITTYWGQVQNTCLQN